MIICPKRITFQRWWRLAKSPYTILRTLEYEALEGLVLRGKILDVGGGEKNSYVGLMKIEGKLESVNIDPDIRPTMFADLNVALPIQSESYDTIISFNTFEHIKNDTVAISEAFRVLKPGGAFHIMVPFLYRVHGSPYDFHRHTATWWEQFIMQNGVKSENLVIEPLMWDPPASAFLMPNSRYYRKPLFKLRRAFVTFLGLLSHARWPGERIPASKERDDHALGYYIHGTK